MTNKKSLKRALILNVLSTLLCVSMLLGTTFAWFTDTVESGVNQIVAGNLDVELTHKNASVPNGETVQGATNLFQIAKWEPGAYTYEVFTVSNVGDLALKYQLSAILANLEGKDYAYNTVIDSDGNNTGISLLTALYVKEIAGDQTPAARPTYSAADGVQLGVYLNGGSVKAAALEPGASATTTIFVYWPQSEDDNQWNLQNGKYASDANAQTVGNLKVGLAISLIATQVESESDSFDNLYDSSTNLVEVTSGAGSAPYSKNSNEDTTVTINGLASTTITSNTTLTYIDDNNEVQTFDDGDVNLIVEPTNDIGNLVVEAGNGTTSYEVTLVTDDGNKISSSDNVIITKLKIGVVDLQKFYHNTTEMTKVDSENDVDADGEYYYDISTGYITMATKSFSPFTSEYVLGGGIGTDAYPYLIEDDVQWNAFYQVVYDFNQEGKVAYFELANDINLAGVEITNYAVNNNNEKVYDHEMNFVLDGKGHSVLNIETLMGYKQPFPYIVDTKIKNITIDYNLVNRTQTCAMTYNCFGGCYFINVTTTGKIETTANWATAFVAYPWHSNVYYTNCINRANLTTNFTSNSYVAPFGSHNGGEEVHIYFDNCKNFGNIAGGHVGGFVGMGNNDHFSFADENAVKNYGSLTYSQNYGYFQCGNTSDTFKTNNTNVTCTVKQSGSSNQKLATLTVNNPSNGEKLVINNIEGATRYVVTVSSTVQVYNYDDSGNANKWSGGFPRSIVGEYVAESGETTETAFINVALKENRDTRLNYQTGEEVTYNGLFVDEAFDINSNDVTVLLGNPEKDAFVLVSYKGEVFYYFMNGQYNGLVSDGATSITLRFDVTAYNGDIVLGTLNTYSYTYSIGE